MYSGRDPSSLRSAQDSFCCHSPRYLWVMIRWGATTETNYYILASYVPLFGVIEQGKVRLLMRREKRRRRSGLFWICRTDTSLVSDRIHVLNQIFRAKETIAGGRRAFLNGRPRMIRTRFIHSALSSGENWRPVIDLLFAPALPGKLKAVPGRRLG